MALKFAIQTVFEIAFEDRVRAKIRAKRSGRDELNRKNS